MTTSDEHIKLQLQVGEDSTWDFKLVAPNPEKKEHDR